MLISGVLLVIGLVILVKGADIFVDSSVGVAETLKMPKMLIGLTIVAIGTALPEITVSAIAATNGQTSMATGNLVGSNVFNLIAILGICGLIAPFDVSVKKIYKNFILSIIIACIILVIFLFGGTYINPWGSAALIVLFFAYMSYNIYESKKEKKALPEKLNVSPEIVELADVLLQTSRSKRNMAKNIVLVIIGVTMVVGGAQLAVDNAVSIAQNLGVTERVIGLTILAIGTSLPEFVTSIVAFKKGEGDLAMGNIIGSNIINLTLILGLVGVISPITIGTEYIFDISVLIIGSLLTLFFITTGKRLVRPEGGVLLAVYIGYLVFLL